MLPPVIAGVDGSAESLASAEWAARKAVRRDRPLRLGHARNWHPRQEDGERATAAPLKAADEHLPEERGNGSTRTAYRDVILGVDLADPCDEVIGFAFQEARPRRSRLKVVHARQHPSPTGLGPGEPGLMSGPERAGEWLGFLTAVLQVWRDKYPGVEVTDTAADRLRRGPARRRPPHHRPSDGPATGPVAHATIHHVGCPVAVVPHD